MDLFDVKSVLSEHNKETKYHFMFIEVKKLQRKLAERKENRCEEVLSRALQCVITQYTTSIKTIYKALWQRTLKKLRTLKNCMM